MSNERNDVRGSALLEKLCGAGNGVGCISEIIDEDGSPVGDGADEKEEIVLSVVELGWAAFLRSSCQLHIPSPTRLV